MIKRIIEFFRRLYLKWFCDIAVDLSDGKDCTGIVHYRQSRSGHVTIHDVKTIPSCENSHFHQVYTVDEMHNIKPEQVNGYWVRTGRQTGKTITATKAFIWQCIKAEHPRIYHLSNYASKRKTRKKNRHRLAMMLREIMND